MAKKEKDIIEKADDLVLDNLFDELDASKPEEKKGEEYNITFEEPELSIDDYLDSDISALLEPEIKTGGVLEPEVVIKEEPVIETPAIEPMVEQPKAEPPKAKVEKPKPAPKPTEKKSDVPKTAVREKTEEINELVDNLVDAVERHAHPGQTDDSDFLDSLVDVEELIRQAVAAVEQEKAELLQELSDVKAQRESEFTQMKDLVEKAESAIVSLKAELEKAKREDYKLLYERYMAVIEYLLKHKQTNEAAYQREKERFKPVE